MDRISMPVAVLFPVDIVTSERATVRGPIWIRVVYAMVWAYSKVLRLHVYHLLHGVGPCDSQACARGVATNATF